VSHGSRPATFGGVLFFSLLLWLEAEVEKEGIVDISLINKYLIRSGRLG
jgi:hypothetical protein